MKKIILSTAILALLTTIISCEKVAEVDTEKPTISIIDPSSTVTFTSGDEVHFKFEVADNDEIHEIESSMTKSHMGTTETVWTKHDHPDAATFTVHGHYTIDSNIMHTDFAITVKATDHTGNEHTETAAFHVMN